MKRLFVFLISLLALTASAQKPFTLPEIASWQAAEGTFAAPQRVSFRDADFRNAANILCEDYVALRHTALRLHAGRAGKGDIALLRDKSLAPEAYRIVVTPKKAELYASTGEGMIWAAQTLLQLYEQSADGQLTCGVIEDAPQYRMRGLVMDCGRKFIPLHYLERLVRCMSYAKLNTLHIHLNDNGFAKYFHEDWDQTYEAFRMESDLFPDLTATDGHYSKDEFRQFQAFARSRGVEIIPEIDFPAHSLSFSKLRPEIGSNEYGRDHLDLFHPSTYTFLDSLLTEYLDPENPVFTGPRFHIGTDEYSNRDKAVVEKFRYLTDRYIRFTEEKGKQAAVWGALTHAQGETPVKSKDVLMYCWYEGYAQPKDMHEQGYQLVSIPDGLVYIVPAAGYYYDYLNCPYLYDNWTPAVMGKTRFEENDPQVEGGMFAVWNDHPGNGISTADIHHRVLPALQTIAQKTWAAARTTLPYEQFDRQRHALSEAPGVDELGVKGRPYALASLPAMSELPADAPQYAGYPYEVSFTIDCQPEELGAILTEDLDARFYLCDPEEGKVAFERDGYLIRFAYQLPTEGTHRISIKGDNESTTLIVDGKTVETLSREWRTMPDTEARMAWVPTLRFPLAQAGDYKSTVRDLLVK